LTTWRSISWKASLSRIGNGQIELGLRHARRKRRQRLRSIIDITSSSSSRWPEARDLAVENVAAAIDCSIDALVAA
jgi:hypothetical protein